MEVWRGIEEMSLNGWPAHHTLLYDGWLLRFADGYTKRSNSINPIYGNSLDVGQKIKRCEQLYREQGQATVFKLTPFVQPNGLDERLADMGYEKIDHTLVKTASLADLQCPGFDNIVLSTELTPLWLDAIQTLQKLSERQKEATRKMYDSLPLKKAFAVLMDGEEAAACGIVTLEQGWAGLYDIVTSESKRGRGYGEQLTRRLLYWAKEQGVEQSYLLVVKNNEAANRLYDKFGFTHLYDYWYRTKAMA
ncbi:GNAT family N-acetyltransferase [Paenibacillus sp. GCM10027627]|uniref:GNAT family N-acetyltransferase n=1 Tax=unclassified Paenibacillus TaxID=185978 RepID=UPI00363EDB68